MTEDPQTHMILVMGVTGSGKSKFINSLVQGAVVEYPGMHSGTQQCQIVRAKMGGDTEVAIVDTPGLDDSKRSDAEILTHITSFLTTQYQLGIALKGIIFLHRITDPKMQGSALKQFEMFQQIVGEDALANVILGTTMWDLLPNQADGFERDMELRKDFWSTMERQGSQIVSVDGSKGKAEGLVRRLMKMEPVVLKIQNEMLVEGKPLGKTSAAQVLAPRRSERQNDDRQLTERIRAAERRGDSGLRKRLEREKQKTHEKQKKEDEEFEKLQSARVAEETQARIEQEKKGSKFKDALMVFAAVAGLAISFVVNVLPLLGVPI